MLIKKPAPLFDDIINERTDTEDFWLVMVFGGALCSLFAGLLATGIATLAMYPFGIDVSEGLIAVFGIAFALIWYAYIFTYRFCAYSRLDFENQRIIDLYMGLPKSNRKDFKGLFELASKNNATYGHYDTFTKLVNELNRRNAVSDAKQQAMRDRQSAVQQMLDQELKITREINKEML